MLFYYFSALFFICHVSSEFQCPKDNKGNSIDGTFRDPSNCAIYYQCINGQSYLQSCPPGLHFKLIIDGCKISSCVSPEISDCKDDLGSTSNESKKSEISSVYNLAKYNRNNDECYPNKNETVGNYLDCRSYFHCINGIGWPQRCPSGFYYSPIIHTRSCIVRMCVTANEALCVVPAAWSEWSAWSQCEPLCGTGLRSRVRKCDNPPPNDDGPGCPGNDLDVELCNNPPCNSNFSPAFLVSFKYNRTLDKGDVNWSSVNLNHGELFDSSSSSLKIKESGMYFFSLTAMVSTKTSLHIDGARIRIGLTEFEKNLPLLSVSRDALYTLNTLDKPKIVQNFPGANAYGDEKVLKTLWTGFYYNSQNYIFAVRDTPVSDIGPFDFSTTVALRGFQRVNGSYITTEPGAYYISYGFATNSKTTIGFANCRPCPILSSRSFVKRANESQIQTFIRRYRSPPRFQMVLRKGLIHSDPENQQIYLSAFKLNTSLPCFSAYFFKKVASSIWATLEFNRLKIDNFSALKNNSYYSIPKNGTYFLSYSLSFNRDFDADVRIVVNNEVKSTSTALKHNGRTSGSLSQSILLELKKNDQVFIQMKGLIEPLNRSYFTVFAVNT